MVLVVAMTLGAASGACDDGGDDDANPTLPSRNTPGPLATDPPNTSSAPTTDPPTTPPPTTDPPPTTAAPTTSTSTTTTTTTAPPTTVFDEAALEAEIAADLIEAHTALSALAAEPTDVDLDTLIAAAAAGEYAEMLTARILRLVESGERVVSGDPPYNQLTVDRVDWTPERPDEAFVLVCSVDNFQVVTGDIGAPVVVEEGELTAVRYDQHVVRTAAGWLPDEFQDQHLGIWRGENACPAP